MRLKFPDDQAVGTLEWRGSWDNARGPVLAVGYVDTPDDEEISLSVSGVQSVEQDRSSGGGFVESRASAETGEVVRKVTHSQGWRATRSSEPVHLGFLLELPERSIAVIHLVGDRCVVRSSVDALPHLAPSLKRLYLSSTDFDDDILQHVAQLENLTFLQTYGNRFTDQGVQQLVALQQLESLYLEEESLTPAAFEFAGRLSRLRRLGVADQWAENDVMVLRERFPGRVR
jgi:hypothetical protein